MKEFFIPRSVTRLGSHSAARARSGGTTSKVEQNEPLRLAVIDPRNLERECFVRCIAMTYPDLRIVGFPSLEQWHDDGGEVNGQCIVIFSIGSRSINEPSTAEQLRAVIEHTQLAVVVMGDSTDLYEMLSALDCGALGYIPSSVGIDEVVEAAKLAAHGGIFLPLPSLAAIRGGLNPAPGAPAEVNAEFTERQLAVCEALRRGKPNKVIAYELSLCESTVKVHIRNIMKKLKVTNRTEAAFKLNMMKSSE